MPVAPDVEWILVACGLIAHADDVLEGKEVERLLAMVDDQIPEHDYADWLAIIGDKAKLEARYASLPEPPADQHRAVLEQAWAMTTVNGTRHTQELLVLARIAERFGVDPMQLEFWRAAWTRDEQLFATCVAELAAMVLGGGEPLYEDDLSPFLDLLERLPTSEQERERLAELPAAPPTDAAALARTLASVPRRRRLRAFELVAPLVRASVYPAPARERLIEIGASAGLLDIATLHPA